MAKGSLEFHEENYGTDENDYIIVMLCLAHESPKPLQFIIKALVPVWVTQRQSWILQKSRETNKRCRNMSQLELHGFAFDVFYNFLGTVLLQRFKEVDARRIENAMWRCWSKRFV